MAEELQYKRYILVVNMGNSNLICTYMMLNSELAVTAQETDLRVIAVWLLKLSSLCAVADKKAAALGIR